MKKPNKKDTLTFRAVGAGFKNFEAEAFIHVRARFEHEICVDERQKCCAAMRQMADAIELETFELPKAVNA